MLKDLAWQLFKKTGNIEFFLQYKNLEKTERSLDFSTEAASAMDLDGEKCRMSKRKE